MNRRSLLAAAAVLAPIGIFAVTGCATTGGGTTSPSFGTIQGYVAAAAATFDKLVPVVAALSPASAAQLQAIQKEADAAAAAFAGLTAPTSASGTAQQVLNLISDGLTVVSAVPGLPPQYAAAIAAAQVLLVAVGTFFTISPQPAASLALGHAEASRALWANAQARYRADPEGAPRAAQAQLRAFLGS